MAELTKTQTRILTASAQRPRYLAMPLPKGLHGAAAHKVVDILIGRGLVVEVDADIRKGEPLWRETGDGQGTTLVVTKTGFAAIGIEPVVVKPKARDTKRSKTRSPAAPKTSPTGTKQAQLISMLEAKSGASIAEIVAVTGWQAHTVRGTISGALKKKLRLGVTSEKIDGRGRVYKIRA